MPHEHTRRKETQKYLRENCYHRIKCTAVSFLAAFIWRRPLNSVVSATATHKKLKKVSDGTCTQVIAPMINKCRVKMIQEELYNVRILPRRGDPKKEKENIVAIKITLPTCLLIYMITDLLEQRFHSILYSLYLLNHLLNPY